MKLRGKYLIIGTFLFLAGINFTYSQAENEQTKGHPKELQKANEMYKNFAYIDAIKIYERIAKRGFVNQELLERLGNSYYFNADYTGALVWYEQLFENPEYKDKISPEY